MFFSKRKGFTLAELLVSVFILVVITSLSLNSFTVWQRDQDLRQGALDILAGLREAQAWALAGKPYNSSEPDGYGLVFNTSANSYLLFADLDGDGLYTPTVDGLIAEKYLPPKVTIYQILPVVSNTLTIDFSLPLARVKINGGTTATEAKIYLKHSLLSEIKLITIKRITGQIGLDNY